MFTDRDTRATYDEESAVRIELNGNSISISSDSVQINGTTAILTEEATYIVSGTLESVIVSFVCMGIPLSMLLE